MKRFSILSVVFFLLFVSCDKEEHIAPPGENEQTVFMYLPWANNLLSYFRTNISDFEKAVERGILKNERVLVFLHTSSKEATLFELKYVKGKCVRETVKNYTDIAYTTREGIASILDDVVRTAPARRYSMVIGCHGMGWIPVGGGAASVRSSLEKEYWEHTGVPLTRWFGGTSDEYRTDITTLADAISSRGLKMEYILFDDCYMSSIEVAWDLRDVADHIIACPTEVMAYGMPYAQMAGHLVGTVDYGGITDSFLDFYNTYSTPCGTIAVTVCRELPALAQVMKSINGSCELDPALLTQVQTMDGYSPTRFFDLGDYVEYLCDDEQLLERFRAQLARTVPHRQHTSHFFTMSRGRIQIDTFSGITVSDPSTSEYTAAKTETSWYAATH